MVFDTPRVLIWEVPPPGLVSVGLGSEKDWQAVYFARAAVKNVVAALAVANWMTSWNPWMIASGRCIAAFG